MKKIQNTMTMTLYKYKSVEHIEDIIVNKRLYCSRFDKLNDPMEWAFTSECDRETIKGLTKDTEKHKWRICCLSEANQYGLMWSFYGDKHEGVCIEVEPKADEEYIEYPDSSDDKKWLYGNIEYAEGPTNLDKPKNHLTHVLFTKSKQWEYEQEVRFIRKMKDGEENSFLPVAVKCVYLGKRMKDDDKIYIKKLCKAFDVPYICMSDQDAPTINYWDAIPAIR